MSVSPIRCRSRERESVGKHEQSLPRPRLCHCVELNARKRRGVTCFVDHDDLEVITRDGCDHRRHSSSCGRTDTQRHRVSKIILGVDVASDKRPLLQCLRRHEVYCTSLQVGLP